MNSSSSSFTNTLENASSNLTSLTIPQAENVLQRILAEKADILRQRLTVSSQLLNTSTEIKVQKQELEDYTNLYNEILPSFHKLYSLIYEAPEPKPREEVPPLPRSSRSSSILPSSLTTLPTIGSSSSNSSRSAAPYNPPLSSLVPSSTTLPFPSSSRNIPLPDTTINSSALTSSSSLGSTTGISFGTIIPSVVLSSSHNGTMIMNDENDLYDAILKRANNVMGKITSSSSRRNSIEISSTNNETVPSSVPSLPLQHILFDSNNKDQLSLHKDIFTSSSTPSSSGKNNNQNTSPSLQTATHPLFNSIQNLESQTVIQQSRLIAGKVMVELNTQETNNSSSSGVGGNVSSDAGALSFSSPSANDATTMIDNTDISSPPVSENMITDEEKESSPSVLPFFSTTDTTSDQRTNSNSFEQERYTYLQEHPSNDTITDTLSSENSSASTSSIPPSSPVTVNNENINTVSVPPPVLLSPAAAVINSARINISKSAAENLSKAMDILESVRTLSLDTSEKLMSTAALQNQLQSARERMNETENNRNNSTVNNISRSIGGLLPPKLPSSVLHPNKYTNLVPNISNSTKDNTDNNISAILSRVAAVTTEVVRSRSNSIVDIAEETILSLPEKTNENGSIPISPQSTNYNGSLLIADTSNINVDNLLQSPTTPLGGSRSNSPIVTVYSLPNTTVFPSVGSDSTMDLFTALLQGAAARVQAEESTVPLLEKKVSSAGTDTAVPTTMAPVNVINDSKKKNNSVTKPKENIVLPSAVDNDLRQELIEVNQQLTNLLNDKSLDNSNNATTSPTSADISEALAMRRKKTEELRNQRKAASSKIQAVLHPMPSSLVTVQALEEYRPENSLVNLYTHVNHSLSPSKDTTPTAGSSSSLSVTPPGFTKNTIDSLQPTNVRSPTRRGGSNQSPSSSSPRPVWIPSGKFHNTPEGSVSTGKPNSPVGNHSHAVRPTGKETQEEGTVQENRVSEEVTKQQTIDNNNSGIISNKNVSNPSIVSIAKATVTALPEHDARSLVKARLLKQRALATKDYTLLKKAVATIIPPPLTVSGSTGMTELTTEPTSATVKTTTKPTVDDVMSNKLMLIAAESIRNNHRISRANSDNAEAIDPMPDVPVPPAELVDTNYHTNGNNSTGSLVSGNNKGAGPNALLSPHTAKRKWVQERIGKKK